MKTTVFTLALCLAVSTATLAQSASFFNNPIQLNGYPLDYSNFTLLSRGVMTLVDPGGSSEKGKQVPFRVYLRRKGVVITEGGMSDKTEYRNVPIHQILSKALPGDELVIDPLYRNDRINRQVITLRMFSWLLFRGVRGDGC
ncbi:hypothetical protein [Arsenicibacter rosenii]|uniref:Uncharacterized protein n=1 Tax=Arsenicibacter rosenii TaxID=1750698 RepID=A0A1S2VGR8_9BACT|nr:hypothetical protein [Arsenicibacter rosenii]OIN57445.1 hypothetical protein BLX24_19640 [Arsenicibacter rosenii]